MYPTYKKIDGAERFLANFWKLFPSFTINRKGNSTLSVDIDIEKKLFTPLLNDSKEFCELQQNGSIVFSPYNRGGIGQIGIMRINEDQREQPVKAITISLYLFGGFVPFYAPVIIKRSNEKVGIVWDVFNPKNIKDPIVFTLSDPMTEIMFGGMLGHLYDLGICPFFSKYFGAYVCKESNTADNRDYIPNIVMERSTIDLKSLLSRDNPYINTINNDPYILINILFQFVYSLYIGKEYLGFTHYDMHLRNLMVTITDNRTISIPDPIDYIYNGKNMNNINCIMMQTPYSDNDGNPMWIAIKYNGIMAKMIDYGACSAFLNKSKNEYNKNFICTLDPDYPNIYIKEAFISCRDNDSIRNTIELQYLLANLQQYMVKGVDRYENTYTVDTSAPVDFATLIDSLNFFSENFYGQVNNPNPNTNISRYMESVHDPSSPNFNYTKGIGAHPNGTLRGLVLDRNANYITQNFDNPKRLLKGLLVLCQNINHSKIVNMLVPDNKGQYYARPINICYLENDLNDDSYYTNPNHILYLLNNATEPIKVMTQFTTFNKIQNDILAQGNQGTNELNKELKNLDINSTIKRKLLSRVRETSIYDKTTGTLRQGIDVSRDLRDKKSDLSNNDLEIYMLQINPKAILSTRSGSGAMVYREYQNWFDLKNIKSSKDGEYIETVNVNIVKINKIRIPEVILNTKDTLWDAAGKNIRPREIGISVNCGYFTVSGNLSALTQGIITREDAINRAPIGFYYNKDDLQNSGTKLPIPKPYREYFAVVTFSPERGFNIYRYNRFLKMHQTKKEPIVYHLENNTYYVSTQKVIRMESGDKIGGRPTARDLSIIQDKDYTLAFCSGPILIWEGQVVFNIDIMLNQQFSIVDDDVPYNQGETKPPNFTNYKIIENAENNKMFTAGEGEINQAYGMRHSNRYMVHNVMAIDVDGNVLFFYIEGRGYNAPGLDRVQLTELISKFNIVSAVSLDGGFSANAVIKSDDNQLRYLMNDPQKRPLGVSMTIKWLK